MITLLLLCVIPALGSDGLYLDKAPPGMMPELFPFEMMPKEYRLHSSPAFSPDGKEVYFSAFLRNKAYSETILYMKLEKGEWSAPRVAPFSGRYFEGAPCFTPDGMRIFYSSARPLEEGNEPKKDRDIWYVERTVDGWSEPVRADFNTASWEDRPYVSAAGNIYYKSFNDIYWVKILDDGFSRPVRMSGCINSEYGEQDPCIAPDESFMVFYSSRPGHLGKENGDLYVSFKGDDGSWSEPRNMGPEINGGHIITRFPRLSPDGQYLFFSKLEAPYKDVIYWVDAAFIDKMRPGKAQGTDFRLDLVFDNYPFEEGLDQGWGFSCLIRGSEKTVLFDTGNQAGVLLSNMAKMGIDPAKIDVIVLSHKHRDHTDGLPGVLERNSGVPVYMLESFPEELKRKARDLGARVIEISAPMMICEDVYTTGEMRARLKREVIGEQALILRTREGLIILTGCGHPGLVKITRTAKDYLKDDVLFVMGGLCLGGEDEETIRTIAAESKKLGICYIAPTHCSGDEARRLFKEAYGDHYLEVGTGRTITLSDFSGE